MDNVTHALAGWLLADLTGALVARPTGASVSPRFRATAVAVGIIAAEWPDADLLYSGPVVGMGPLGYLLHHRGHTHTIFWGLVGALALWWGARWRWRKSTQAPLHAEPMTPVESRALLLLAVGGSLSHLLLDWTNSYGVHPFWPLDNRWFYGDAVFIVEPWLWVIAIPALIWGARSRVGRLLLWALLLLILTACWGLGEVTRPVALAISAGALLWLGVQRAAHERFRAPLGAAAWLLVTLLFVVARNEARAQVKATDARGTIRDVVLNPAPGDPSCWLAVVVSTDGVMYRVSNALVAAAPTWRGRADCAQAYAGRRLGLDALAQLPDVSPTVPFDTTSRGVQWRSTWATPRSELVALATDRCEFAVALRFMRTPVWQEFANGRILLSDARYGVGGGGFSDLLIAPYPTPCSLTNRWVPGWVPPRDDMLRGVAPSLVP